MVGLAAEAVAAWRGPLVAWRSDIVGGSVCGAWRRGRQDALLEAHGGPLRGREGDVGDVVGVVAAD